MRRSSDMPQGHTGPGRRSISSSEGWLSAPFTVRWGFRSWAQGVSCGTITILSWQAGSCPGIPKGMHARGAAPQQPHSGSLLAGMAQVGMCLARQWLSKHVGAQLGALRGMETEQERKLLPWGSPYLGVPCAPSL